MRQSIINTLVLISIGLGLLCLAGCKIDFPPCPTCPQNGYCFFSDCKCKTGFSGTNCTSRLRKFIGTYVGSVIVNGSTTIAQIDSLTISSDSTSLFLNTNNITYYPNLLFVNDVGLTISDTLGALNIATTPIDLADSAGVLRSFGGTGFLSSDLTTLKLNYSVRTLYPSDTTTVSYSFTGTRQ